MPGSGRPTLHRTWSREPPDLVHAYGWLGGAGRPIGRTPSPYPDRANVFGIGRDIAWPCRDGTKRTRAHRAPSGTQCWAGNGRELRRRGCAGPAVSRAATSIRLDLRRGRRALHADRSGGLAQWSATHSVHGPESAVAQRPRYHDPRVAQGARRGTGDRGNRSYERRSRRCADAAGTSRVPTSAWVIGYVSPAVPPVTNSRNSSAPPTSWRALPDSHPAPPPCYRPWPAGPPVIAASVGVLADVVLDASPAW